MNKALALVFVATFAIIVAVEANQQHQRLFRPAPWIPLNIPIPRPVAPVVPPTGTQPAACPAGTAGCLTCGTTDPLKCSATDGTTGTCLATGTACPAGCTGTPCPPACATGCTP
ncbi:hypothetical protein Ocin01_13191 [Orchesella cincta]|uniref:Uncharacterized protein n=1 Tax=Orchesella cincta TaxID=48709 RepID=A0A1D2MK95_ORCCI|nr:hypothetical protein Ocin01_13191 [Orchesella cincta]